MYNILFFKWVTDFLQFFILAYKLNLGFINNCLTHRFSVYLDYSLMERIS